MMKVPSDVLQSTGWKTADKRHVGKTEKKI